MKRVFIVLSVAALLLSSCSNVHSDVDSNDTFSNDTEISTETNEYVETDRETDGESKNEMDNPDDGIIHVEKIELDKYEVNIEVGSTDMPWVTMFPEDAENLTEMWSSSDESVATVNHYGKITGVAPGKCTVTVKSEDNPAASATVKVEVVAAKGVTYIDGILIANKTYSLPASYAPGVDATAQSALNKMISEAAEDGINLYVISSYRSYSTQESLYNNYVARDGVAAADRYSARPGHSEHQTGLAFDLNSLDQSWGETDEGKWLAANCHKYGFIIRYPKEKEDVTGYMYEPWHVRYLGEGVAEKVYNSGKCLEEYLGITSEYAN